MGATSSAKSGSRDGACQELMNLSRHVAPARITLLTHETTHTTTIHKVTTTVSQRLAYSFSGLPVNG